MSIAFLIIDMQQVEAGWMMPGHCAALSGVLLDLEAKLQKFDVHVVNIASGFDPMVGEFQAVNQEIESRYGRSLRHGPYRFCYPLDDKAIVGTKGVYTYSAKTDPLVKYLNALNVDTIVIGGVCEWGSFNERACVTATAMDFAKEGNYRAIIFDGGTDLAKGSNRPWLRAFPELSIEALSDRDILQLAQAEYLRHALIRNRVGDRSAILIPALAS
jgi:nicotinamidase-related amidase